MANNFAAVSDNCTTTVPPPPLLFSGDGLDTRLEFSISLSMLGRAPPPTAAAAAAANNVGGAAIDDKTALMPIMALPPPPRIQSHAKRKSLRHLIHAHVRRPAADTSATTARGMSGRQANCEKAAAADCVVDAFNLPLPKLPSPLASFGVEIQWPGDSSSVNGGGGGGGGGATMLERAPPPVVNQAVQPAAAVAEAEVLPTLGNVIESDDDDDDIGSHHLIPAVQRGEEETSLPLQQPPPPLAAVADQARSSMPALNGSPIERRWSSSSGVTDKPQRRRSLMFQPLVDVAAVGALIDTFADRPLLAPAMAPTIATTSAAAPPPPHASDTAATDGPRQRIIGGLRRATTVISANRHKLKLLKRRPSAEMLSAIESVQPDDDEFSEKDTVAPQKQQQQPMANQEAAAAAAATPASPPTHRVRRAGTLNIAALRQQQQQQPSAATARLKRSPTHHGQPPPQPQPIAAASTDISATGSLGLGGGYAPIAVSLKSSRSRQFLLNTPLGEFEVLRTLGQGSYGKVKLMRSALTAEQFAVKIIKRYPPHKHRRGHAEFRKAKTLDRRVVREANLAAILGQLHPHIVPLHDFRVTDTHFYLFYAYVSGVTLAERVGSSGLSEREARAVFKPVVETIRFCHQYSVIHRDIKLENVLIDYADEAQDAWPLLGRGGGGGAASSAAALSSAGATGAGLRALAGTLHRSASGGAAIASRRGGGGGGGGGGGADDASSGAAATSGGGGGGEHAPADYRTASVFDGRVKIIDFGLANFFDGTSLMETFCGSLPYTAPEILRGDAYIGPEIDVWSLGVLLYVMMTGQFPFEDPAQIRNFDKIMAGDFTLRPTMSRALQDLLIKMLEPNSKRRITMQGVLQHEWLVMAVNAAASTGGGGSRVVVGGSLSFAALCDPLPSAATGIVPAPGTCCAHHPYALTDAIHDRRTLLLPGPTINCVVAREVATCLDRGLDEVMRLLDAAMSAGRKKSTSSSSKSNATLSIHQGTAAAHQWPSALNELNSQSTLIEVPNSPVISVYALVLQQISMRRYYLELPVAEPSCLSTTLSSSSQLAASTYGYSGGGGGGGGLRDMVAETTSKSQTLVDRLTTQLSHLVSMTGSLISGSNNNNNESASPLKRQSRVTDIIAIDSLVQQPAYMQPLSTGHHHHHNNNRHQSASLGGGGSGRMRLRASRTRDSSTSQIASASMLNINEPRIRYIGALEEIHDRIALPSELSSLPAEEVLGLVSSLLKVHEITHTFVETLRMPMQKALDTSVFPLKTIAAMVSSAYLPQSQPPPPPPPSSSSSPTHDGIDNHQPHASNIRTLLQGIFSKQSTPAPALEQRSVVRANSHCAGSPRRRLTQLRARASIRHHNRHQQQSPQQQHQHHSTLTIVHPHLSAAAAVAAADHYQQPLSSSSPPSPPPLPLHALPPPPSSHARQQPIPNPVVIGDMPEITTTVPVKYATAVIFAQYSPSLNRWRETEVVEYYSCSVRIELVRIGGPGSSLRHHHHHHPRFALLVDRMTGHKGKFSLFKMFLHRMVAALPAMVPEKFEPRPAVDPLITVC